MKVGRFASIVVYSLIAVCILMGVGPSRALAQQDHANMNMSLQNDQASATDDAANTLMKVVRDATERFKDVTVAEAAGYSLVQLIETSAITGHFCDLSGDAYIDIFSCKDFDVELAVEVVRAAFRPQHINFITLVRQAVTPRASYMLAAEYVLAED